MSLFTRRFAASGVGLALIAATAMIFSGSIAPVRASQPSVRPIAPDMGGARILYEVSGGLAAVTTTFRVFDSGAVAYKWDRAVGGLNWSFDSRIPDGELRALKSLFLASDFESLPVRFTPDGVIMDGSRILVAAVLSDGTVKTVLSETGAIEDPRFTVIRRSLDRLVSDLRATEVVRVVSYVDIPGGRERIFTMLADGRYRCEMRRDQLPISWIEGQCTYAERRKMLGVVNEFDFNKTHLVVGPLLPGVQNEVFRLNPTGFEAVHFSERNLDPSIAGLHALVDMVGEVAELP